MNFSDRRFLTTSSLLLVALLIRLPVFFAVKVSVQETSSSGFDSISYNTPDSLQYALLARNLVEEGIFSPDYSEPFEPNLVRTPGYPLFLSALYILANGHNTLLIVGIQILISLINVILVFYLASQLINLIAGWMVGLLYAVAPMSIVMTGFVMTETLFTLCFLLGIVLLLNKTDRKLLLVIFAFVSGLLFAYSTLIRPIGVYFIVIPLLFLFIHYWRKSIGLVLVLVLLTSYILGVTPWYVRNWSLFDNIIFSSASNSNMMRFQAAYILAQRDNIPIGEARNQIYADMDNRIHAIMEHQPSLNAAEVAQIQGAVAKDVLLADPIHTLIYYTVSATNSLRPGYSSLLLFLQSDDEENSEAFHESNMGRSFLKLPLREQILLIYTTGYYAILYMGTLIGIIRSVWQRNWVTLILVVFSISYYIYLPGALGNSRFRVPVEGLMALLAIYGFWFLLKRLPLVQRLSLNLNTTPVI